MSDNLLGMSDEDFIRNAGSLEESYTEPEEAQDEPQEESELDTDSGEEYEQDASEGSEATGSDDDEQDDSEDEPETDEDEEEAAENLELPGADLSGEELAVRVVPKQTDEFTCSRCFLVQHHTQLARGEGAKSICKDCA